MSFSCPKGIADDKTSFTVKPSVMTVRKRAYALWEQDPSGSGTPLGSRSRRLLLERYEAYYIAHLHEGQGDRGYKVGKELKKAAKKAAKKAEK